jgi:hypothetical protein
LVLLAHCWYTGISGPPQHANVQLSMVGQQNPVKFNNEHCILSVHSAEKKTVGKSEGKSDGESEGMLEIVGDTEGASVGPVVTGAVVIGAPVGAEVTGADETGATEIGAPLTGAPVGIFVGASLSSMGAAEGASVGSIGASDGAGEGSDVVF